MTLRLVVNGPELTQAIRHIRDSPTILIPIFEDARLHPQNNKLAMLCAYVANEGIVYGIPFSMYDCDNLSYMVLDNIRTESILWTPDKKKLVKHLPHLRLHDIQSLRYVHTGKGLSRSDHYSPSILALLRKLHGNIGVNQSIPAYKWLEFARDYGNQLYDIVEVADDSDSSYKFLNTVALPALEWIESSGIAVDEKELAEHFKVKSPRFVQDGMVYSEYNPFTATGRPSCKFGGINFAALNKKDGSRKAFISRFGDRGQLVLLDYESYHLRLIADLMGYQLPEGSVHEYLGKQYFDVDSLTPEQYEQSKEKTFQYLYSEAETDIPFFQKVKETRRILWEVAQRDGYVESPIYKKKIVLDQIWDPSPSKLFNYYIQFMETEYNMNRLFHLRTVFDGYKSKIVLYNYDSVLIDFCLDDGRELLEKTKRILSWDGQFPLHSEVGSDFHTLRDFNLR